MTCVLGAIDPWNEALPEVKLKNGTVLHNFQVVGVGSTTVVARWAGGQGSVALTQLPPELQAALAAAAAPKSVAEPEPAPMVSADLAAAVLPTEIKLTNGVVMHHSVVTHWEEDAVIVSYPGGIIPVRFKNIMPEQRVIFEARRVEALAAQAQQLAEKIRADKAATQAEMERQTLGIEASVNPRSYEGMQIISFRVIPEVKLMDGTQLHNMTVRAVASDYIVASWDGGQGDILLTQLPHELRDFLVFEAGRKPGTAAETKPGVTAGAAVESRANLRMPTEIKLTNGFVMHRSVVVRWEEHAVLVKYPGGIVWTQFQNIAPEQRASFELRKAEALAAQAKADAAQASVDRAISNVESAQEAKKAKWKEEDEQQDAAIREGLAGHYLVRGMTKDQVRQVMGTPQMSDVKDSLTFVYPNRGLDKHGAAATRYVQFNQQMILTGWNDQRDNDFSGAVQH